MYPKMRCKLLVTIVYPLQGYKNMSLIRASC